MQIAFSDTKIQASHQRAAAAAAAPLLLQDIERGGSRRRRRRRKINLYEINRTPRRGRSSSSSSCLALKVNNWLAYYLLFSAVALLRHWLICCSCRRRFFTCWLAGLLAHGFKNAAWLKTIFLSSSHSKRLDSEEEHSLCQLAALLPAVVTGQKKSVSTLAVYFLEFG